jgi:hypothetical protein
VAAIPGPGDDEVAHAERTLAEPVEDTELRFDTEWSQSSTESRPQFAALHVHPGRSRVERSFAADPTPSRPPPPKQVDLHRRRPWWALLVFLAVGLALGYGVPWSPSGSKSSARGQAPRAPEVEPPRVEPIAKPAPLPDDAEVESAPPAHVSPLRPLAKRLRASDRRRARRVGAVPDEPAPSMAEPPALDVRAVDPATKLRPLLRIRGLLTTDVELIAGSEHAEWREALGSGDAARERDSFEKLAAVLQVAPMDRDLLRRKLSQVLRALRAADAKGRLERDRARILEARYFELRRDLLAPGLEPDSAMAQSLNESINALLGEILGD